MTFCLNLDFCEEGKEDALSLLFDRILHSQNRKVHYPPLYVLKPNCKSCTAPLELTLLDLRHMHHNSPFRQLDLLFMKFCMQPCINSLEYFHSCNPYAPDSGPFALLELRLHLLILLLTDILDQRLLQVVQDVILLLLIRIFASFGLHLLILDEFDH